MGKAMLKKCPFLCGCTMMPLPWKAPIALSSKGCLYPLDQEQHQSNGQCFVRLQQGELEVKCRLAYMVGCVFFAPTVISWTSHAKVQLPLVQTVHTPQKLFARISLWRLLLLFHLLQEHSYIILFLHTKSRTLTV